MAKVTTFGSKCTSFLRVFVQYGPTRTLFPRIYQEQHGENGGRNHPLEDCCYLNHGGKPRSNANDDEEDEEGQVGEEEDEDVTLWPVQLNLSACHGGLCAQDVHSTVDHVRFV